MKYVVVKDTRKNKECQLCGGVITPPMPSHVNNNARPRSHFHKTCWLQDRIRLLDEARKVYLKDLAFAEKVMEEAVSTYSPNEFPRNINLTISSSSPRKIEKFGGSIKNE